MAAKPAGIDTERNYVTVTLCIANVGHLSPSPPPESYHIGHLPSIPNPNTNISFTPPDPARQNYLVASSGVNWV